MKTKAQLKYIYLYQTQAHSKLNVHGYTTKNKIKIKSEIKKTNTKCFTVKSVRMCRENLQGIYSEEMVSKPLPRYDNNQTEDK